MYSKLHLVCEDLIETSIKETVNSVLFYLRKLRKSMSCITSDIICVIFRNK